MRWKVRLNGHDSGLETLSDSFTDDPEIFEEDEEYFIWSSEFRNLDEPQEVRTTAQDLVKIIRNFGEQDSLPVSELKVSTVHEIEDDGTETVHTHASISISSVGAYATITTKTEDGEEKTLLPGERTYELTSLAQTDDKVRELVNLLDRGESWVNLYKIYEYIQANIKGDKNIVDRGWWTKGDKELFKRTANSRGAIGDDARHGQDRIPAPEDPMTHSKAKTHVRSLVDNWLEYRERLHDQG